MIKLLVHGGSENHGCEAIVRSTVKILNRDDIELYSFNKNQDIRYNLNNVVDIKDDIKMPNKFSIPYLKYFLVYNLLKKDGFEKYEYYRHIGRKHIFKEATNEDIALSIGGDNYCYENTNYLYEYNRGFLKKNAKTVLWGCSVEPKVVTQKVKHDLESYSLITTRESLSYNFLKDINKNTYLIPDPAFVLESIELDLPQNFKFKNTIGINISPMIIYNEKKEGITKKNYEYLIDYVLKETDMNIALIPHVIVDWSDDRKPIEELYEKYKHTNRVVKIKDHNCMELKGYISRCRFFIGARTHSTIAAYSSCVPTLVLGYSIKARGIAKDIFGTEENYVLPVQNLNNEDDLLNSFKYILNNEMKIKSHLQDIMPNYCKRAYEGVRYINQLIEG